MINVAGKPFEETDVIVHDELERCGITIITHTDLVEHPEVHTHFTGRLGKICFRRHWYYWGARGPVPIEVAQKLYETPVGQKDIRVAGHCGCPPPEQPWTTWRLPDGRHVVPAKEREEYRQFVERDVLPARYLESYVFSDDPKSVGASCFVDSYHIDSELGLYLFAKAVRRL
jgi:hypothetical protein